MQDVVITGVGVQTPMGQSCREVREAFTAGKPLTRRLQGPADQARAGALVRCPGTPSDPAGLEAGRHPVLAPALAAWADAGLATAAPGGDRIGVYLGTGPGPLHHSAASLVAAALGLRGACETFISGCASSATALGEAFRAIRHGYLDAALVGGVDSPLAEGAYRAWEAAGLLAPPQADPVCRPFDRQRNGALLGEGAVLFVLESAAHARLRKARVHARLAGVGSFTDVTRTGDPDPGSRALALERCLKDARLGADQIGYISADAWGDRSSDACEVLALRRVFGARLSQVAISATKSIHGHMAGASAAAGLLPALLALQEGVIAPTATLDEIDPEFSDLSLSAECLQARLPLQAALVNSFAPGGANACFALTRH